MKDILVDFIIQSDEHRQLPFTQVAEQTGLGISTVSVRRALRSRGFRRCRALLKPPISEANRVKRLQFAINHLLWTRQD